MMICRKLVERMARLALLALFASACSPQFAPTDSTLPTGTIAEVQYSDPFTYCAAIGTIDAPDERYVGAAVPEAVISSLREKAEIADDAPDDWISAGTVWRCMDGEVWGCFVGANLPCSEKADTSATPQPEMQDFCNANPNAETIPAAITGRATIYEWRCVDAAPQLLRQLFEPDPQGFLSDFWYELSPQ